MTMIKKIDFLMQTKGFSRMGFAKASGVPYTTLVNLYKSGTENIKLSTLCKIANALNVSLDYLAYDDQERSPNLSTENFTDQKFEIYVHEHQERVQELLSMFSSEDLAEQIRRRLK